MKISDKERLKKIIKTWKSLQKQMEEHHITREILLNDEFSQWAVTTPLYNIGEQVYMLSADFKKAFEGLFTDAQDFGYPFFGMSVSRARTLYKVSGNCTVRYYDKSKISYDVNSFYYHDEASGEFTLALLMLGNDIAYKDDAALANIVRFIDKATMSVIKPYI
jgi:hypothetical protein